MNAEKIIFGGPSCTNLPKVHDGNLHVLPPCKQGDVYLAAIENPKVIGIIDGYFEGVPSVWHKEILWAMDQGIHVIGASSMGALRAAELDTYGMKGLGQVYEWYATNTINDDDEVALVHAPDALNYTPISLAMVNVRATCKKAQHEKILSDKLAEEIQKTAKAIFYKHRTWQEVLDQMPKSDFVPEERIQFESWLQHNEVDQKSLDALQLYTYLSQNEFSDPYESNFEFEYTEFWHQTTSRWIERTARQEPDDERNGDGYRLFS